MDHQQAIRYIHNINWQFCNPGLSRIRELCEKLGHPEKTLRFIHVAGTNGKGSFCAMCSSVLRAAGYTVGTFTSPYIRTFYERMQVNGQNISSAELAELTTRLQPIADEMDEKPTEFELITALAFLFFQKHGCDVVVLETGLGGRLDSTNIIDTPILSVITGIGMDHTAILGDTPAAIAQEKAGIIKPGVPVLFGGGDPSVTTVIQKQATAQNAAFVSTDHTALALKKADLSGSLFDFKGWQDVFIPLLGLYQLKNAANLLTAVDLLREQGLAISDKAVYDGLKNTVWHGRFEVVCRDPLILFDGAHNPQGVRGAVNSIKQYFPGQKICLCTGVLKDKEYTDIAGMLAEIAHTAFTVTPDSPRALPAEEYAAVLQRAGVSAYGFDRIADGFAAAKAAAKEQGCPLLCVGSLYLYASLYPLF